MYLALFLINQIQLKCVNLGPINSKSVNLELKFVERIHLKLTSFKLINMKKKTTSKLRRDYAGNSNTRAHCVNYH